jgi:hypothetical protein
VRSVVGLAVAAAVAATVVVAVIRIDAAANGGANDATDDRAVPAASAVANGCSDDGACNGIEVAVTGDCGRRHRHCRYHYRTQEFLVQHGISFHSGEITMICMEWTISAAGA